MRRSTVQPSESANQDNRLQGIGDRNRPHTAGDRVDNDDREPDQDSVGLIDAAERMADKSIARFSQRIGHSLDYALEWS